MKKLAKFAEALILNPGGSTFGPSSPVAPGSKRARKAGFHLLQKPGSNRWVRVDPGSQLAGVSELDAGILNGKASPSEGIANTFLTGFQLLLGVSVG